MNGAELQLPPEYSAQRAERLRREVGPWLSDRRVEGVVMIRGDAASPPGRAPADLWVIADLEGGAELFPARPVVGPSWLRLAVSSYDVFVKELRERFRASAGPAAGIFVAYDRDGRLRDARLGLEAESARALLRARTAAAAGTAAALHEASAALGAANPGDAAAALFRAATGLAELEALNNGVWPPAAGPFLGAEGKPAYRLFERVRRAGPGAAELGEVLAEAKGAFGRALPAAAAHIFDYIIKNGGSVSAAGVVDSLELADLPNVDSLLAALHEYRLVELGREERSVPGLSGLTYGEAVLTLP
jgi:hypothetical protein